MELVLKFQGVSLAYKHTPIIEDVSFELYKGDLVYLIGRTGSGKSTILKSIYADIKPTHGSIEVGKYNIQTISSDNIPYLRRQLGIIFQDFQLLPDRNVGDNIAFVCRATGWTNSQAIKNKVMAVLMRVGLSHKVNSMPHELSGGEQQRTVIARALVNDPILLIADEPTGNLDPEVSMMILKTLKEINEEGTAILMATHDHSLMEKFPAKVIECKNGKVTKSW